MQKTSNNFENPQAMPWKKITQWSFFAREKKEDSGSVEPCMPGALHLWSRRASRHPPGILSGSQGLWVLALRLENAISYLLCVCCTQGCRKEDPQT